MIERVISQIVTLPMTQRVVDPFHFQSRLNLNIYSLHSNPGFIPNLTSVKLESNEALDFTLQFGVTWEPLSWIFRSSNAQ